MKKKMSIAAVVILLILVAAGGYFVGYRAGSKQSEENKRPQGNSYTFYATITEIYEDSFLVDGMDVNDINFRNEITFSKSDEISYIWRGTEIKASDLEVGDNISITFEGDILETYPSQLLDVTKVYLLDDKW